MSSPPSPGPGGLFNTTCRFRGDVGRRDRCGSWAFRSEDDRLPDSVLSLSPARDVALTCVMALARRWRTAPRSEDLLLALRMDRYGAGTPLLLVVVVAGSSSPPFPVPPLSPRLSFRVGDAPGLTSPPDPATTTTPQAPGTAAVDTTDTFPFFASTSTLDDLSFRFEPLRGDGMKVGGAGTEGEDSTDGEAGGLGSG